jgi:membrane protein implicated in regulation of membrane protease activity
VLLILAVLAAVFWLPTGWGIVVVAAATAFELAEAGFWVWLSKRRKAVTGAEALPGARGVVVVPCRPDGQVRVQGELWRARCEEGADVGDEIVVERLDDGLTLIVSRTKKDGN